MYKKYFEDRVFAAPVFEGLSALGVSGRQIASILRVSSASVSKWKTGRSILTDENLVFLSLMLGNEIIAVQEGHNASPAWAYIGVAKSKLEEQEMLNRDISPIAVWKGVRKYRLRWNAEKNTSDFISKR